MALCEKHGRFIPEGQVCGECFREDHETKKKKMKEEVISLKKAWIKQRQFGSLRQATKKASARRTAKDKLQRYISEYIKLFYKSIGVYYDWITLKRNDQKGLFGLHAAHYYPKGELWQLWCDPVNIGLTGYSNNVVKPETAPMMRSKMIDVWGEKNVQDLDKRALEAKQRIDLGIDPRHPDDMWILAMTKVMKEKIKQFKKENNV